MNNSFIFPCSGFFNIMTCWFADFLHHLILLCNDVNLASTYYNQLCASPQSGNHSREHYQEERMEVILLIYSNWLTCMWKLSNFITSGISFWKCCISTFLIIIIVGKGAPLNYLKGNSYFLDKCRALASERL